VDRCRALGIEAIGLIKQDEMSAEDEAALQSGMFSIVFSSPEALLSGDRMTLLRQFSKDICLLAYDEVHCLSQWGEDFRPDYLKVVQLRGIFPGVPCLGLSATINQKVLDDTFTQLSLEEEDVSIVAIPPDRPNIFLEVVI